MPRRRNHDSFGRPFAAVVQNSPEGGGYTWNGTASGTALTPLVVARRMRAARKAAGLSGERLGARIGVSDSAIYCWENARRDPGIAGIIAIAAALDLPAASFFDEGAGCV